MTTKNRKWDRKRWLWFAAILICVPALTGFYSWSCLTPVYGIFPSACDYKEPGCQAAMIDAGVWDGDLNTVMVKPDDLTEKLLVQPEASSMFSLNSWSEQLEPCSQNYNPMVDAQYVLDANPSTPGTIDQFQNCTLPNYTGSCYCFHRFKNGNPANPFNIWLDKFVQYKQCGSDADGRSGLIQLGPIFSFGRGVPAYLHDVPFNHPDMIKAFARLWDDMSAVLAQAKFTLPPLPTNEFPNRPEWIISIGNEINLYLDNPSAINIVVDGAGPFATPAEQVQAAWSKYSTFYQRARDYVRGLDVDTDGNGTLDLQNTSTPQLTWITFSTTWSSTEEIPCTPGWAFTHPTADCPIIQYIDSYIPMLANSTFVSYTYYPYPFGFPPGTPGKDAPFFKGQVSADLVNMKAASQLVAPLTMGRQLPIVLQEVGYPSSRVEPNMTVQLGDYNRDNIADQQEAFVQGTIQALRDYNDDWIPEPAWWAAALFNPPPPAMQGPFEAPRIVSYNAFMLHDFFDFTTIGVCPFERFHPDPMFNGIAPTHLGVFLCSLGVRTEAAAEKDAGGGKTPWRTFVQEAEQITDAGLDPNRDCP